MAARTLANLADMTQDKLLAGIIDSLTKHDEVSAAFVANASVTDRPSIKFNRYASVPTPVYADCSTSFTNQSISGSPVTVNLLTLGVQFASCRIGSNLYSTFTSAIGSELEGAIKGMREKIGADVVGNGNGSTAIYGIQSLATNSFNAAVSGAVDVSDLDRLIDEVKVKSGREVLIGSPATVRAVLKELRSESGGMDYQTLAGTEMRTPAYQGYNILKSEFVTSGKLFMVNPVDGYNLNFGVMDDQTIGGVFGYQDLGPSQTNFDHLWRIYCHIAGISLNPQGIAVLNNVL